MNDILEQMLNIRQPENNEEKKNALKEVIQEIALCGLSRGGFFHKAAFYGGTALRIFYGLDRFSEDLDFSLMKPDENFDLRAYFPYLENEFQAYGLNLKIEQKEKNKDSFIKSAFIKGNTKEHWLKIYQGGEQIPKNEVLKVKFEIDTDPPEGASFERKYRLLPSPYEINLYDGPSLFAGKIHAVICRGWKDRIKGRDLYDYVFYLSHNMRVNILHLKSRLIESEYISAEDEFGVDEVRSMLDKRFDSIDFSQAKKDVMPFIKDPKSLDIWSSDFFKQITGDLKASP